MHVSTLTLPPPHLCLEFSHSQGSLTKGISHDRTSYFLFILLGNFQTSELNYIWWRRVIISCCFEKRRPNSLWLEPPSSSPHIFNSSIQLPGLGPLRKHLDVSQELKYTITNHRRSACGWGHPFYDLRPLSDVVPDPLASLYEVAAYVIAILYK